MTLFRVLFLTLLVELPVLLTAQDTLYLSLPEVIALAQSDAPDVQIAKTSLSNNFWRYQSFLADFKPQINFTSSLPNLNRSIESITLPDGTDKFISRSLMRNSMDIRLQQDISLTGATVFARTGLQRIDIFATDGGDNFISYLSTPISIGIVQPLSGFNAMRWDRRIEPLRFDEAQKAYSEDMEDVAYEAAQLFFDVLIAQLNLKAAIRDKGNADTLYVISKGRFDVGRIAETELLQIELNTMNADADLAASTLDLQTSIEQLRNFVGIQQAVFFKLDPPDEIPVFQIDGEKALHYAILNRSEMVNFERRLKEAQRDVAQAKGNSGPNVDLFVSFGLSQTGQTLSDAYKSPLDQEVLQLGLEIPIADWGKARARMEIARSNQELIQLQVAQDKVNFERDIIIKVQQFDLVRNQINLAKRAYLVAQRRLDITRKRYRIGKILVTDLNIAIREEAEGRRSYMNALRNFWLAHYDLRRLTFYDFERDVPLVKD